MLGKWFLWNDFFITAVGVDKTKWDGQGLSLRSLVPTDPLLKEFACYHG